MPILWVASQNPDASRRPTRKAIPMDLENITEATTADPTESLTAEALIEEVSIDGMCGVY